MAQTASQYRIPNQNGGHFKIQDGLIVIHSNKLENIYQNRACPDCPGRNPRRPAVNKVGVQYLDLFFILK
jgi:hypothetical protein